MNIFLFLVYVVSVFVDIYNGYVQHIKGTETIIPILYKGGIIVYSMSFLLKNRKVLFSASILGVLYLCCTLHWGVCGYLSSWGGSIIDLAKLFYPFGILAVLYVNKGNVDVYKIVNYIVWYSVIASISIIVTAALGIGVLSYGETFGYGSKGFFVAGNDISVGLIIGNCLTSYLVTIKNKLRYLFCSVVITIASMMIGSTAGIIGAVANYVFLILQLMLMRRKMSKLSKWFCVFIIVIGLPVLGRWFEQIRNTDSYTIEKYDVERLTSGGARQFLEDAFWQASDQFTVGDWVFGLGDQEFPERVGRVLGGGRHAVELDQYDLIGSYGIVLGGIILLIPIVYLCRYMTDVLRYKRLFSYWVVIMLGLFIAHGFTAGHAYVGVQSMPMIMGVLFLYQYRRQFV